ncbi:MAG: maltotransferase domain-containing protein [Chromatiales bacterium]
MTPMVNDRWETSFLVTALGRYRYTVAAWVDPSRPGAPLCRRRGARACGGRPRICRRRRASQEPGGGSFLPRGWSRTNL